MDIGFALNILALGLACASGLALGVLGMIIVYVLTGRTTWARWRRRSRPLLWYFGLDWPEVKRTWKRAFRVYYERGLLELQPENSASELPGTDSLDESGDVPPASYPPTNLLTETQ
jgi:hypothetical protein